MGLVATMDLVGREDRDIGVVSLMFSLFFSFCFLWQSPRDINPDPTKSNRTEPL